MLPFLQQITAKKLSQKAHPKAQEFGSWYFTTTAAEKCQFSKKRRPMSFQKNGTQPQKPESKLPKDWISGRKKKVLRT